MDRSTFNGWTSWATWNVAFWFTKDEGLALARRQFLLRCLRLGGKTVRAFVLGVLPDGTPDFQGHGGAACYRQVCWPELAEAWRADRRLALKNRRR